MLYARPRNEASEVVLAFAGPAAVAFAFELDQAAKAEQGWELFWLLEGAKHAGEIARRRDLRADSLAERLQSSSRARRRLPLPPADVR